MVIPLAVSLTIDKKFNLTFHIYLKIIDNKLLIVATQICLRPAKIVVFLQLLFLLALFIVLFFSSPEPKAQVSYCHSAPSVVRPSSSVRP